MAERKQCIKCGRAIDAYARICPYCNWDQEEPVPAVVAEQNAVPQYIPPKDNRLRNRLIGVIGGVVLLIAAFGIGLLVHGKNPPPVPADKEALAAAAAAGKGKPSPRANVTLVPVTDSNPDVEAPITSAPIPNLQQGVPTEYQRTDATAVASVEYAQMAQRANAEKKKKAAEALVDPRSITTPAVTADTTPPPQTSAASTPAGQTPRPNDQVNFPSAPSHVVVSTRPVPTFQPLPDITVTQPVTAKLQLTVGADGYVKEVNVLQGIPGETGKLIASLQKWRFKPAMENGSPVEAPFTVDVSFNPHE